MYPLKNNIYILSTIIITVVSAVNFLDLSALSAGGIILIVGAYYAYQGNMYFSIISYTVADSCWITNAIEHGDVLGSIAISTGILVGLIVAVKMKTGIFSKSIVKETDEK